MTPGREIFRRRAIRPAMDRAADAGPHGPRPRAGARPGRRRRRDAAVPAEGRLPGVSRLGRRRPQDGQPDAGRRQPARDPARPRDPDHDDQVRTAGHRHAGVRQARLHRRPLLRHETGRPEVARRPMPTRPRPFSRARSSSSPTSCSPRWSARAGWITPSASRSGAARSTRATSCRSDAALAASSTCAQMGLSAAQTHRRREMFAIAARSQAGFAPHFPAPIRWLPFSSARTRTDSSILQLVALHRMQVAAAGLHGENCFGPIAT